jgi:REP element-mobilizing transposase RayT
MAPTNGLYRVGMYLEPYSLDELNFAFRCYVYFRWHTYRRCTMPALKQLSASALGAIHPEIQVLEFNTSEDEIALLAGLEPLETVSSAASKLKGATSKLLRNLMTENSGSRLGGGYFAATTGSIDWEQLNQYLDCQAEHHGYDRSAQPPIWVQSWDVTDSDLDLLQPIHARVLLRWHIVLSTWNRVGVFDGEAARAICEDWAQKSADWKVRFQKVSMVPDHVHVAVWTHATVAPGRLIVDMLNSSQTLMSEHYPRLLIEGGQPRLWKPGSFVGSFGDITKGRVRSYLRSWEHKVQARG